MAPCISRTYSRTRGLWLRTQTHQHQHDHHCYHHHHHTIISTPQPQGNRARTGGVILVPALRVVAWGRLEVSRTRAVAGARAGVQEAEAFIVSIHDVGEGLAVGLVETAVRALLLTLLQAAAEARAGRAAPNGPRKPRNLIIFLFACA